MDNARKATDVLLDLESKVDVLINLVKSQKLTQEILSNKLNIALELLEKNSVENKTSLPEKPKFTIEASDNEKNILINSDFNLLTESEPKGFRRTSRPETYSKPAIQKHKNVVEKPAEVIFNPPNLETFNNESLTSNKPQEDISKKEILQSPIIVSQRIVDVNGKSVFLAEVEVKKNDTLELVSKTRTGATGKWSIPLNTGIYKLFIKKRDLKTKEVVTTTQDLTVDGNNSLLTLDTLILK